MPDRDIVDITDSDELSLANALASMAPHGVISGVRRIRDDDRQHLWPDEQRAIASAGSVRQREFSSGRVLLRQLLNQSVSLPPVSGRGPQFPNGVTGTLAHDRTFVAAAVTSRLDIRSIGVDLEPCGPFDAELVHAILGPRDAPHLDARLVLAIKEAVYKVWSTLGGRFLEFHEVIVSTTSAHQFRAAVQVDGMAEPTIIGGRFTTAAKRWMTLAVIWEPSSAAGSC